VPGTGGCPQVGQVVLDLRRNLAWTMRATMPPRSSCRSGARRPKGVRPTAADDDEAAAPIFSL
jgi:hypothetical protein